MLNQTSFINNIHSLIDRVDLLFKRANFWSIYLWLIEYLRYLFNFNTYFYIAYQHEHWIEYLKCLYVSKIYIDY